MSRPWRLGRGRSRCRQIRADDWVRRPDSNGLRFAAIGVARVFSLPPPVTLRGAALGNDLPIARARFQKTPTSRLDRKFA